MEKEKTIFISYRRDDSAHAAGRLYDRLSQHFGSDRIFMDIDTIELGDDFVNSIETAVRSCDVLVSIIGNRWLSVTNADGQRRLDDPNDFVRLEVVSALNQGVNVIPILVDGAGMPQVGDLPEALFSLTRRNGLVLDHTRFNADVDRLIRGIEAIFTVRSAREAADAEMDNPDGLSVELAKADRVTAEREAVIEVQRTNLIDPGQALASISDEILKEPRRLILLVITLGWLISGITFGITLMFEIVPTMEPPLLPASLGGIFGALVIALGLKRLVTLVRMDTLMIFVIGWVIGITIGWSMSFPYGDIQIDNFIPLGGVIGGAIVGLATGYILSKIFINMRWKNIAFISTGWSVAWAIGLIINYQLYDNFSSSFIIFFFPFLMTTAFLGSLLFWQAGQFERQ